MIPTAFIMEAATLIVLILVLVAVGKLASCVTKAGHVIREAIDRVRDTVHDKELHLKDDRNK